MNASDRDTGRNKEFRFSVAGGDLRKLFRINSTTGELFVAKPLDREETAIHDLTIRATNLGKRLCFAGLGRFCGGCCGTC